MVWSVVTLFALGLLGVAGVKPQDNSPKMRFCGSALSNALGLVCDNVFNGKRSMDTDTDELNTGSYWMSGEFGDADSDSDVFMDRSQALKLFKRVHGPPRTRGGVADECCLKPCSYNEMSAYCAPK